MKIQKSFELLNSEGPIIKIEKIQGNWHYKFDGSRQHHITTPKEILSAIWNNDYIIDHTTNKNYRLGDYPISMKGDDPKYYEEIIKHLISDELEKIKKNSLYFKDNYLTT
jgi:hypothetical protein